MCVCGEAVTLNPSSAAETSSFESLPFTQKPFASVLLYSSCGDLSGASMERLTACKKCVSTAASTIFYLLGHACTT